MTCSHCVGAGKFFDTRTARSQLKRYRRKGPRTTTQMLVSFLADESPTGVNSVLDIGGGIGVVHLELLATGAERAVNVDAAAGSIEVAKEAAAERGWSDRVLYIEGDFVDVASEIETSDVVALDRVVCCYLDAARLVSAAAQKTRGRMGLVVPRDRWWMRWLLRGPNAYLRLRRNPFRVYAHRHAVLNDAAAAEGLVCTGQTSKGLWTVLGYERRDPI